jgi:hypothetical protein
MKLNKEAEAIKTAFYKRLTKEKAEAGDAVSEDAFTEIENGFKAYYNTYKKERAEYNARQEKEREENLVKKEAVIADLKALLEKQEDVNATFPAFREIQDRWRAIGPVPVQNYRNINDTYQLYVEQFYDMVKINRELRDLDFKKNLEAKEKFCEMAEKLAGNENIVEAFKELQKLHEQWKEYGPVAKQFREEIWDRFKAATAVINKKYQAYFEGAADRESCCQDCPLRESRGDSRQGNQKFCRLECPVKGNRGNPEAVEDHRVCHKEGEPEDLRQVPRGMRQVLWQEKGVLHRIQGQHECQS